LRFGGIPPSTEVRPAGEQATKAKVG